LRPFAATRNNLVRQRMPYGSAILGGSFREHA